MRFRVSGEPGHRFEWVAWCQDPRGNIFVEVLDLGTKRSPKKLMRYFRPDRIVIDSKLKKALKRNRELTSKLGSTS